MKPDLERTLAPGNDWPSVQAGSISASLSCAHCKKPLVNRSELLIGEDGVALCFWCAHVEAQG
jgi:hypothetical protein